MNPQRPQRPLGVLLSALALGLVALFLILFAFTTMAGATATQHFGAVGAPGTPQSPAFTAAVMLVMVFIDLGLAGWSIATLIGLFRMRPWARISTMVIAAGLAFFGLISAVAMFGMQSLIAAGNVPLPPNVPPATLQKVVVFMAVLSLLLAAAGIGWLIYLANRRTRDAFTHAALSSQSQHPQAWPAQPGYTHSTTQQTFQPDPLTDFTVARPIAPPVSEPVPAPSPEWQTWQPASDVHPQPTPWPIIPIPPHTRLRTGRPMSITVLAVFALISAVFSLFGLVSPFPALLFGYMVSGWPVHLYSLVWATAAAIAGLGMLRLQRPAWILSFFLLGVSAVNALTMLLPAGRARYAAYIVSMQQNSPFGNAATPLPAQIMAVSMAMGMVFGLAVMIVCAVLLWRARWAFEPTALPTSGEVENS